MSVNSGPAAEPLVWRVEWADYTDHHDWIGRRQLGRASHATRQPPPRKQWRDFTSYAVAVEWSAQLVRILGRDNVAIAVRDLQKPLRRARAPQPLLPGDWPRQLRGS